MDIGVWGDSITYGSSDKDALGWVGRLRKIHSPEKDEEAVYDRGICGDTSRGLLKRFTSELSSFVYPLDVVIFAVGMNDVVERNNQFSEVSIEDFESNMREVILQAQKSVSRVYVIGITNVDESRTVPLVGSTSGKKYLNETIQKYNQVLKSLCTELQAPFVSVFGLLENEDLADGLHPNDAGYEKLFLTISGSLK